jgi:hypothetical protein
MTGTARRGGWLAAALLGAWGVPFLADLAHLDALLPLLVWIATAALLPGGTTVLDRLVIAFAALVAAVCVAGLVLTVWPPQLSPVPVAGTALTALVLLAAVSGRRPRWPGTPFAWRDGPVLVVAVVATVVAWAPVAGRDPTGRLAVVLSGEDLSRHFMIFDWIGRSGGYLFERDTTAGLLDPGYVNYPQGSHLVAALLERFREPAGQVDAYMSLSHYLDYTLGAYVFLAVAVAWAVSWVWAGVLRPAWAVVTYAVLAAVVCFGDLLTLITRGYPSQLTGLALLVVLVALAARPLAAGPLAASPSTAGQATTPAVSGTQLVLVGALTAASSFVYYFYTPLAVLAVVAWAWPRRAALRRRPLLVAVTALATAALSAVTPLVNQAADPLGALTYGGPAVKPSTSWLAVLTLLGVLTFAGRGRPGARASWRDPVRRTLLVVALGTVAFVVALLAARFALGQGVTYYLKKGLYGLLVLELIVLGGFGATAVTAVGEATMFGRLRGVGKRAPRWLAPVVAVSVALGLLAGARVVDPRPARGVPIFLPVPAAGSNYGRAYAEGRLALPAHAAAVVRAARGQPEAPRGRLIVFWDAYGRGYDFYAAQWANALDRRLDAGTTAAMVKIPQPRPAGDELEKLLTSLTDRPDGARPVEVVTRSDAVAARVEAFRAAHPGADPTVLRLPGDCGAVCLK